MRALHLRSRRSPAWWLGVWLWSCGGGGRAGDDQADTTDDLLDVAAANDGAAADDDAAGAPQPDVDVGAPGDATASTPDGAGEDTPYATLEAWICHGRARDDLCDDDLSYSVVEADGSVRVISIAPAPDPGIDCFYVYPTASADAAPFSDWTIGAEEEFVTRMQLAPLAEVCRAYAPVYRQLTLPALLGLVDPPTDREPAYRDVLDAWRYYLAHENDGRGVILVGHSQGAGHLRRVLAEEVEPNDDLHRRLVAAYLIGATVEVPDGAEVGGSFARTPLCRAATDTACVVSFASYRETAPPGDAARFGRPGPRGRAACNPPSDLSGAEAPLDGRFSTEVSGLFGLIVGTATSPFADPRAHAALTTAEFAAPGLLSGRCVSNPAASYLQVTVHADPADPRVDDVRGDLDDSWGLHVVDMALVTNDFVRLARAQAAAYLDAR